MPFRPWNKYYIRLCKCLSSLFLYKYRDSLNCHSVFGYWKNMFTRSGNVCQLFLNGDYCPSIPGIKYCIIALQMVVKHLRLSVLSYSGPRRVFTYKNNLYINMIQKLIADSRGLKANFRCKNTEMKMESQTFFLKKLKVTFRSLKNPFSSISVKKDSRGGSITSLPPAPILNRTGGNSPKILFNQSSGNPLLY